MPSASLPEAEFVRLYQTIGPEALAQQQGITRRAVQRRRQRIERNRGHPIVSLEERAQRGDGSLHTAGRAKASLQDGTVLIGSDPHFWPGEPTTAWRAFRKFASDLQPEIVVLNGDVFDGAGISRHQRIGWEKFPSVANQLETSRERLEEVEEAAPDARRFWPMGNHDARFETRLANLLPEFAKVKGVHLKDHFGDWTPCWSLHINSQFAIKHRTNSGGVHASRNNPLKAGISMATGHTHRLQVRAVSDYTGTRWGIETGTLAEPYGPQFEWMEDDPADWQSGFVIVTFAGGQMLWPEFVHVIGPGKVGFRDQILEV